MGGSVPELNQIVTVLSSRKYALNLREVREQYVILEVALGQFSPEYFSFFSLSIIASPMFFINSVIIQKTDNGPTKGRISK
jgi:hypothetical protein